MHVVHTAFPCEAPPPHRFTCIEDGSNAPQVQRNGQAKRTGASLLLNGGAHRTISFFLFYIFDVQPAVNVVSWSGTVGFVARRKCNGLFSTPPKGIGLFLHQRCCIPGWNHLRCRWWGMGPTCPVPHAPAFQRSPVPFGLCTLSEALFSEWGVELR